jgi:hypothetical protein
MLRKIQLQNCVDWNIRARDSARRRETSALHSGNVLTAVSATRDARRFQRNIDKLNEELAQI